MTWFNLDSPGSNLNSALLMYFRSEVALKKLLSNWKFAWEEGGTRRRERAAARHIKIRGKKGFENSGE